MHQSAVSHPVHTALEIGVGIRDKEMPQGTLALGMLPCPGDNSEESIGRTQLLGK